MNASAIVVHDETSKQPGVFNLNQNWGAASGQGLFLNVPVTAQRVGTYSGTLTWALSDVPGNN